MNTIHKQLLVLQAKQCLNADYSIKPLSVQIQEPGRFAIWYETPKTDSDSEMVDHTIHIVGTGHDIPLPAESSGMLELQYISTVQDGAFVWHFYLERA